jgi:hypothetical protein
LGTSRLEAPLHSKQRPRNGPPVAHPNARQAHSIAEEFFRCVTLKAFHSHSPGLSALSRTTLGTDPNKGANPVRVQLIVRNMLKLA